MTDLFTQQMLSKLTEIENREEQPSQEEWIGILHDVVMCSTLKMEDRIRGLAQMDRITGEDEDLTPELVKFYVSEHEHGQEFFKNDLSPEAVTEYCLNYTDPGGIKGRD